MGGGDASDGGGYGGESGGGRGGCRRRPAGAGRREAAASARRPTSTTWTTTSRSSRKRKKRGIRAFPSPTRRQAFLRAAFFGRSFRAPPILTVRLAVPSSFAPGSPCRVRLLAGFRHRAAVPSGCRLQCPLRRAGAARKASAAAPILQGRTSPPQPWIYQQARSLRPTSAEQSASCCASTTGGIPRSGRRRHGLRSCVRCWT